ncbi:MAG: 2-C-methyl-D-erythritol 2,4-cyclodiphosphate synthase [Clostridiales bacterium]|nr:2-C-methyl-D-erythritol 2,4-cyclodiphosphate synthase [Clostridiales bacterium]
MRVGLGYDVHKLVEGRDLIIGGVNIPHTKGLLGHSDADVLVHAIIDALLGAASLGDIGKHFPDASDEYKGINSLLLLERVSELLKEYNYTINNIDATIIAEKPKMAEYISLMQENIAKTLEASKNAISIKATTTEGLGFVGKGEGISAQAIVTIINCK